MGSRSRSCGPSAVGDGGLRTVFRDAALWVVDKPAGLPTQAARGGGDNLYDRARAEAPYVGLHHRLDTAASGLVLLVVDPGVNAVVAAAFREHRIRRSYRAVAWGAVEAGFWDRPVEGKAAHTDVEVVGRGRGMTALLLRPRTGRKHQLRVHAALAGAPLVGDRRYGGEASARWPRLALHAAGLGLAHPVGGAELALEAPLPDDLAPLWDSLVD